MPNLCIDPDPSISTTPSSAFSFFSKGWGGVRASAGNDLQLIRARASTFKILADREFDNLINSTKNNEDLEFEFVKRIQPKLSELRRAYSAPNFEFPSLAGIEKGKTKRRIMRKGSVDEKKEWELVKNFKLKLKEFEQKSQFDKIFRNFKSNELVEKVKSNLKYIYKEPQVLKEVSPLELYDLLACLVRQSRPLFNHLGTCKDVCDKVVESLCSRRKDPPACNSSSLLENEIINDELDFQASSFWTSSQKSNDLSEHKRHVAIVTTASLPWMTGTAVNPLFRAAYLAKTEKQNVTLLVPWLCKADQELVYPNSLTFASPEEQETYIRNWVQERVGFKAGFKISFYPGKFSKDRRSILPAGDTSQFIPPKEADIAILEEPEHLNWYHHGKRWTDKFNHVVGVVHTNYLEYIKREKNGALQAFLVKHINNWVTRAYCHKVLRLSAATQDLPRSTVCNVHGVNPKFLKVGEKFTEDGQQGHHPFSKGAYFLGKMVWAKGYRELIDLLSNNKSELRGFGLDVYGNGEDSSAVQSTAKKLDLNINFIKGRDHADDSLHGYKVFVNPSVSDVLCTATAEALAMGKFVVCADHPSNDFFRSFPNCITYKSPEDFIAKVSEALSKEPQPLSPEQRYNLSWEAATERFIEYSELNKVLNNNTKGSNNKVGNGMIRKSVSLPSLTEVVDGGLAFAHYCLTGSEILRLSTGAIPNSRDYDAQLGQDLHLLPPRVQNPIYNW